MSFPGLWRSCHLLYRLVGCRLLCPFIFLSIYRTAWQQSFTHQEEIKSLDNCLFSVLFSSPNVSQECFHPSVFRRPGRKMDNGWWCGWQSARTLKLMKRRENLIRKALLRPQHYEKSQIKTHTSEPLCCFFSLNAFYPQTPVICPSLLTYEGKSTDTHTVCYYEDYSRFSSI